MKWNERNTFTLHYITNVLYIMTFRIEIYFYRCIYSLYNSYHYIVNVTHCLITDFYPQIFVLFLRNLLNITDKLKKKKKMIELLDYSCFSIKIYFLFRIIIRNKIEGSTKYKRTTMCNILIKWLTLLSFNCI